MPDKKMVRKKVAAVEVDEIEPDRFKSLTNKDRIFCREYVQDWNGKRAYLRAFGGKDGTASSAASIILQRKRIRLYCEYLNENAEQTVGVSRTWVLQQHLKIVRSSIAHFHDTWIDRVDFDKLTPEQKECIEEITTQTRTEKAEVEGEEIDVQVDYVKIKLFNKQKALDAITRLMGYEKAQRVDVTTLGKAIGDGTTVNVQINVYNNGPLLADSEKNIKG